MNFYQLIQDLTDSELGHLTKRLSADNSNNNIAVIHTLRAQKAYNSKEIQDKFGWDNNTLTTRLNTAQEATLKFLRERTRGEKVTNAIESKLQDIRILFNRSLYNAATAAAKKADRAAQKVQAKPLTEAQIWRLKIAFAQSNLGLIKKQIDEVENLYNTAKKPIPYNLAYWILFLKVVSIMRRGNIERRNKQSLYELSQIEKSPLLSNTFVPNDVQQKALYHYVKSLIEQLNGKTLKAIEHAKEMIQTFEDNRLLIEADSSVYVSGLSNICLMFLSLEGNQGKAINSYLKKLKEAPTTRKDSRQNILTRYYQILLFFAQKNGDAKGIVEVVQEFTTLKKQFQAPVLAELFSLIASGVLIGTGAYQQALDYLTPLLNKSSKELDNCTTIPNAKILYLLCLYGMKQDEFFKSMYSPTRQYLKRKGYWDKGIDLLFGFFKKALKFKDKQEARQAAMTLQKVIITHQNANGITGFLCYIDLPLCLEQIINHQSEQLNPLFDVSKQPYLS